MTAAVAVREEVQINATTLKYVIPHELKSFSVTWKIFWVSIIWILGILVDRFWFSLDHTIPAWDQADYLNIKKVAMVEQLEQYILDKGLF